MRPHHKFWPARLPHAITPPATSLWQNLAVSAMRYPDKAAIVFFGRVMSWAQLKHDAERLAAQLQALGVSKGDRVVLNMQNCPQLIVAHFAILRADAVVVAAVRADVLVALQVGLVEHRLALGAFDPQAFGHLAALGAVFGFLDLWGQQFFKPAHGRTPCLIARL